MAKRFFVLLLATVMMVSLFAACGESGATTAATTQATTAATTTATTSATESEETTPGAQAEGEEFPVELPLADEKVTVTVWGNTPRTGSGMTDYNDSIAYQRMEELTNVHLDWTHPTSGTL